MTAIRQKLMQLTAQPTVSGFESGAFPLLAELVGDGADRVYSDRLGSVHAVRSCGEEVAPVILLDAHIDEIGMIVTSIADGGFLRVAPVGGLDSRLLCASEVEISGREATVSGVVCSTPPHLSDGHDDKLPKVEDIAIDTGYSREEAEKLIGIGAPVRFRVPFTLLGESQVCASGLDNKACCVVLLEVLERLRGADIGVDLHCLFSVQEETGLAGAKTGAFPVDASLAIVLDVNFAMQPDCDERRCVKFGGGPAFSLSASTSIAQTRRMMEYAERGGFAHTSLVEATDTGTNARAIAISREGIPTVVVSVPLKNMHTPSEIVSASDIDATAALIADYIRNWRCGNA